LIIFRIVLLIVWRAAMARGENALRANRPGRRFAHPIRPGDDHLTDASKITRREPEAFRSQGNAILVLALFGRAD
jgi:hypothetical protein